MSYVHYPQMDDKSLSGAECVHGPKIASPRGMAPPKWRTCDMNWVESLEMSCPSFLDKVGTNI